MIEKLFTYFKKISWKFWRYLFTTIVVVIAFVLIVKIKVDENRDLEINGAYTIGEVVDIDYSRGTSIVVIFEVKKKVYKSYYQTTWTSGIGEKFIVKYSIKNPDNNKIIFESPLFTKDERTIDTIGVITEFVSLPRGVVFKYYARTYQFKKMPEITDCYYEWVTIDLYRTTKVTDSIFERININDTFQVQYLTKDPERAIMHFDKPLNKKNVIENNDAIFYNK